MRTMYRAPKTLYFHGDHPVKRFRLVFYDEHECLMNKTRDIQYQGVDI